MPSSVINRLGAAALLVLAVHELPDPNKELLDQAEQLCNYIRTQQRPDGSLALDDAAGGSPTALADPDGVNHHPGQALYALVRSQKRRPQAWKLEAVRKAFPYYSTLWKTHKTADYACWQSAAWAEAFALTKDRAWAAFVLEMSDWVCGLQYDRIDPSHPRWYGGFRAQANERVTDPAPTALGAACATSLAEGCRVARELADLQRHERYSAALERGLQFLCSLQYVNADTQHFEPWYRTRLLGGFHGSPTDGNLRIDYTQHAVCALLDYLTYVAANP
jgi:hypothetical protein